MDLYIILDNTLNQALMYGFLALSVYISLRLLDFPDLTIEGSFPLGAAVASSAATFLGLGWGCVFIATLAGFIAGTITAYLHTHLKLGKLLSGILVAIGLYSINFRIMKASANMYLVGSENIFRPLKNANNNLVYQIFGQDSKMIIYPLINLSLLILVCIVILLLIKLLKTEKGTVVRFARSDSRFFLESIGINYKNHVIIGLGIANALAAFAGALIAFHSGSASITMGFGIILIALVSLVIGEQTIRLFHKDLTDLWPVIMSPFVGCFVYYLIIKLIRTLNSIWQSYQGYPDPTSQLQFFNSDVRAISAIIMILIYVFRRKQILELNIPERL